MNELPTRSSEDRELPNAPTTMPIDTAKMPLERPTTQPIQRGGKITSSPRGAVGSVSLNSENVFMFKTQGSQRISISCASASAASAIQLSSAAATFVWAFARFALMRASAV